MYLGRIVECGETQALVAAPKHPYTRALFAAALPSRPDAGGDSVVLAGEVPSPLNPPSGCHFHPRCEHAMPACREQSPVLAESGDRHVACHLYTARPL
jgi:oligopeptide/dipeptide ABC transporter ATP-binding protein